MKADKGRFNFLLSCSAYLLATILDLVFTYIATPNLLLEGNPLSNQPNFGWTGLIAINVITFIGYVFMARYAFDFERASFGITFKASSNLRRQCTQQPAMVRSSFSFSRVW